MATCSRSAESSGVKWVQEAVMDCGGSGFTVREMAGNRMLKSALKAPECVPI